MVHCVLDRGSGGAPQVAGAYHERIEAPPVAVGWGAQHEDEGCACQTAAHGDDLGMLCHQALLQKNDLNPTVCEGSCNFLHIDAGTDTLDTAPLGQISQQYIVPSTHQKLNHRHVDAMKKEFSGSRVSKMPCCQHQSDRLRLLCVLPCVA